MHCEVIGLCSMPLRLVSIWPGGSEPVRVVGRLVLRLAEEETPRGVTTVRDDRLG